MSPSQVSRCLLFEVLHILFDVCAEVDNLHRASFARVSLLLSCSWHIYICHNIYIDTDISTAVTTTQLRQQPRDCYNKRSRKRSRERCIRYACVCVCVCVCVYARHARGNACTIVIYCHCLRGVGRYIRGETLVRGVGRYIRGGMLVAKLATS